MKNILLLIIAVFLIACSNNQSHESANTDQDVSSGAQASGTAAKLHGKVTKQSLFESHATFKANYLQSAVNSKQLNLLGSVQKPAHLIIIFGTWCHDSQREVPRLLRLLDMVNNPNLTYQLVAINQDKSIPTTSKLSYQIEYTPTIIIERNTQEIARIIEKPTASWSIDLASILLR